MQAENGGVGLYKRLLEPNDDDINRFADVVLDLCYQILVGVAGGSVFPSLEETRILNGTSLHSVAESMILA